MPNEGVTLHWHDHWVRCAALRAYGLALRADLQQPQPQPQPLEIQPAQPAGAVSAETDTTMLRAAEGLLEVRIVRLDDTIAHRPVVTSVRSWRETATEHFVSPNTVFAAVEQASWDGLNRAVSWALR